MITPAQISAAQEVYDLRDAPEPQESGHKEERYCDDDESADKYQSEQLATARSESAFDAMIAKYNTR